MTPNEKLIQKHYDHGWIEYKEKKPTEHGYYPTLYEHKDGEQMWKCLWFGDYPHWSRGPKFDIPQFSYKDYVKEVIMYYPEMFWFYNPCVMNLKQYPPGTKGLPPMMQDDGEG